SDHGVRDLQSPSRAGCREAGRRALQPDVSSKCDGLWRLAAPSLRSGAQQPGGVGLRPGTCSHQERRHALAFNVGQTEENYRIRELADIVQAVVPGSRIEYAKDGGPDPRCYRVDFGKIHRLLPEFKPQWNAHRGAEELYAAYQAVGLVIDDCEGPRFKRIDHLKQLLAAGRLDPTLRW